MKSWHVVVKVTSEGEAAKPGKSFTLSLDRTPVTIGALPENDVVLAHPWVSGAHAHVVVSHGGLVVHDHSRNGTFVGGHRVESAPLASGEAVAIPPFTLSFDLVSGAEERLTRAFDGGALATEAPPPPRDALDVETATAMRKAVPPPEPPAEIAPPPASPRPAAAAPPRPTPAPPRPAPVPPVPPVPPARPAPVAPAAPAVPPAARAPMAPPPREARAAPSGASIEVRDGPPNVPRRRVALPARPFSIGRDTEADLVLALPTISRLHAEIRPRGTDGWVVRDLGSSNGTSVNGQKVTEAPLRPGDEVHLPGGVVLALVIGDTPAGLAPPPLPAAAFQVSARASAQADTVEPEDSTIRPGSGAGTAALQVGERRAGPGDAVLVLELAGRVDGYNYTQLGQVLDAVVDRGEQLVAIDLSRVDFMDHAGLGVLVKSAAAVEDAGGHLRLCGLSQRLSDSFSLSRLDVFFRGKIARDARAAVQSLARR
jgi:anti-anti-sigma factor